MISVGAGCCWCCLCCCSSPFDPPRDPPRTTALTASDFAEGLDKLAASASSESTGAVVVWPAAPPPPPGVACLSACPFCDGTTALVLAFFAGLLVLPLLPRVVLGLPWGVCVLAGLLLLLPAPPQLSPAPLPPLLPPPPPGPSGLPSRMLQPQWASHPPQKAHCDGLRHLDLKKHKMGPLRVRMR